MVFIKSKNLKLLEVIGKGSFSNVYMCELENKKYAAKEYKKKYNYYGEKEFKILKILKNGNIYNQYPIIDIIDKIYYMNKLFIIMELGKVNLYNYYKKNDITLFDFKYIANQLVNGLDYIHNFIIHGDLKPENIMIDSNKNIKIIDFSSSILLNSLNNNKNVPCIQSIYYRSPEILYSICINIKNDIWSLGCILYEILFKEPLFEFNSETDMIYGIAKILGIPYKYDSYKYCPIFKKYFYLYGKYYYSKNSVYNFDNYTDINIFLFNKLNKKFKDKQDDKIANFISKMITYDINDRVSTKILKNDFFLFKK